MDLGHQIGVFGRVNKAAHAVTDSCCMGNAATFVGDVVGAEGLVDCACKPAGVASVADTADVAADLPTHILASCAVGLNLAAADAAGVLLRASDAVPLDAPDELQKPPNGFDTRSLAFSLGARRHGINSCWYARQDLQST